MAEPEVKFHIGFEKLPGKVSGSRITQKEFTQSARKSLGVWEKNVRKTLEGLDQVSVYAVRRALQPIFALSKVYCPIKTGALIESGEIRVHYHTKRKVRGVISYGGNGSVPYAAIVHEDVTKYHEPPTRSKFLQVAIEEMHKEVWKVVIDSYKEVIGGKRRG